MENNILGNFISKKETNDSKEIFALAFEFLKTAENQKSLYYDIANKKLVQQLIELYYKTIKVDYETMSYNFRKKYIENEAKVEYNDEDLQIEYLGIGYMYDYIQNYNTEKSFDLFVEGLNLHQLLYKAYDEKFNSDQEKIHEEYLRQLEEAKKNKDVAEWKRINAILRKESGTSKRFGGNLRDQEVDLKNVDYHVPSAKDAKAFFNEFMKPEKKIEYYNMLSSTSILAYIEYCVKISVDIIKNQPFNNGNKRTSRALLNLMFKNKNIPPVYILNHERKAYKDALLKAITEGDYKDITNFYCFKICDSIYELDIKPYLNRKNQSNDIIESPSNMVDDDSDMKFYNKL